MIQSGLILKLASKFEEEVERAADTLRSGQLATLTPKSSEPHIEVIDAEPFEHLSEKWVDECVNNLLLAKNNIEQAFRKVREFDPDVEMLFYNIDRYVNLAESAYREAVAV